MVGKSHNVGKIVILGEQQAPQDSPQTYRLDRPVLAKAPMKHPELSNASPSQSSRAAFSRPMDPTILSLGLLLMQIIVGRSIQDLALDPDTKGIDFILDKQSIAAEMTRLVLENSGMNHASAV